MFTVTKAEQYDCLVIKLTFDTGWAIYRIDEGSGSLTVESDWGSYGYMWGHGGRGGRTLVKFLEDAGADYVADKLTSGSSRQQAFDAEKTKAEMWAEVKTHPLSDEERDQLEEDIADFCRAMEDDPAGINAAPLVHASVLMLQHFDPIHEWTRWRMSGRREILGNELVPALQNYLKETHAKQLGDGGAEG